MEKFLPFVGWKQRHRETKESHSRITGPIRTWVLQAHTCKCSSKSNKSLVCLKCLASSPSSLFSYEDAGKTTHQKVSAQDRKEMGCSEIIKASQVRESWLGQWGTSPLFILINRPLWTMQQYSELLSWHQHHPSQHEYWNILNLSYFLRHLSSRKLWWKGYYVAVCHIMEHSLWATV